MAKVKKKPFNWMFFWQDRSKPASNFKSRIVNRKPSKMQIASKISLGQSIVTEANGNVQTFLKPPFQTFHPDNLQKWPTPMINFGEIQADGDKCWLNSKTTPFSFLYSQPRDFSSFNHVFYQLQKSNRTIASPPPESTRIENDNQDKLTLDVVYVKRNAPIGCSYNMTQNNNVLKKTASPDECKLTGSSPVSSPLPSPSVPPPKSPCTNVNHQATSMSTIPVNLPDKEIQPQLPTTEGQCNLSTPNIITCGGLKGAWFIYSQPFGVAVWQRFNKIANCYDVPQTVCRYPPADKPDNCTCSSDYGIPCLISPFVIQPDKDKKKKLVKDKKTCKNTSSAIVCDSSGSEVEEPLSKKEKSKGKTKDKCKTDCKVQKSSNPQVSECSSKHRHKCCYRDQNVQTDCLKVKPKTFESHPHRKQQYYPSEDSDSRTLIINNKKKLGDRLGSFSTRKRQAPDLRSFDSVISCDEITVGQTSYTSVTPASDVKTTSINEKHHPINCVRECSSEDNSKLNGDNGNSRSMYKNSSHDKKEHKHQTVNNNKHLSESYHPQFTSTNFSPDCGDTKPTIKNSLFDMLKEVKKRIDEVLNWKGARESDNCDCLIKSDESEFVDFCPCERCDVKRKETFVATCTKSKSTTCCSYTTTQYDMMNEKDVNCCCSSESNSCPCCNTDASARHLSKPSPFDNFCQCTSTLQNRSMGSFADYHILGDPAWPDFFSFQ